MHLLLEGINLLDLGGILELIESLPQLSDLSLVGVLFLLEGEYFLVQSLILGRKILLVSLGLFDLLVLIVISYEPPCVWLQL